MAAVHLTEMDAYFAQKCLHYVRYMDDFVLLTRTRGQLRKAIRQLNQWFATFGFHQHPDKTFIGRVSKGVDWLGAWLTHTRITGVAPRALENHRERWLQWVQCVLKDPKSANRASPHGENIGRPF